MHPWQGPGDERPNPGQYLLNSILPSASSHAVLTDSDQLWSSFNFPLHLPKHLPNSTHPHQDSEFRAWDAQTPMLTMSFPSLPQLTKGHWLKRYVVPQDRAAMEWDSVSGSVLQITRRYLTSPKSLEHVQELIAVSADALPAHPWTQTSLKCKWHSS